MAIKNVFSEVVMSVKIMTKAESELYEYTLDEWWKGLDWNVKGDIRKLVESVKRPINKDLPLVYADDMELNQINITTFSFDAGPEDLTEPD